MCEILATNSQSAISYSETKRKKAEALGIDYTAITFDKDVHQEQVLDKIHSLNEDSSVHGVLIGMPSYAHIDADLLVDAIDSIKDIDGLGSRNSYLLYSNQEHLGIAPATALAAIHIMNLHNTVAGKPVTLVGRGRTVGRPLAAMLVNRSATLTVCHSKTPASQLEAAIRSAEVVITAMGVPGILSPDWFHDGQVVIDCGISFIEGRTTGDIDSTAASNNGAFVTPVPKGVGAVTNSMIFGNLVRAVRLNKDMQ